MADTIIMTYPNTRMFQPGTEVELLHGTHYGVYYVTEVSDTTVTLAKCSFWRRCWFGLRNFWNWLKQTIYEDYFQ